MFQCLCGTCEEHKLIEELERAQEYFNEHAVMGCAVEILNVEPESDPSSGTLPQSESSGRAGQPADE